MSEHKALTGVEIKDADAGIVQAVFATLDVVDADGDITISGAFEDGAPVRISAYGHTSWGGALPTGKGVIHEDGNQAILDGQFFLKTQTGRDHFETVKEMGPLMQWSYGFDVLERSDPSDEQKKDGALQILEKLDVHEVSPVLLGAGVDTRTLAVKELKRAIAFVSTATSESTWDGPANKSNLRNDGTASYYRRAFAWIDPDADPATKTAYKFIHHEVSGDGTVGAANLAACSTGIAVLNGGRTGTTIPDADRQGVWNHLAGHLRDADREPPPLKASLETFPEHFDYGLGVVDGLLDRVEGWGRDSKAGRVLSAANRERLSGLSSSLGDVMQRIEELLAESDPEKGRSELVRELMRYEHLRSAL